MTTQRGGQRKAAEKPDGVTMTRVSDGAPWTAQSEQEAVELEAHGFRRDDPTAVAPRGTPSGAVDTDSSKAGSSGG